MEGGGVVRDYRENRPIQLGPHTNSSNSYISLSLCQTSQYQMAVFIVNMSHF